MVLACMDVCRQACCMYWGRETGAYGVLCSCSDIRQKQMIVCEDSLDSFTLGTFYTVDVC